MSLGISQYLVDISYLDICNILLSQRNDGIIDVFLMLCVMLCDLPMNDCLTTLLDARFNLI